MKTFDLIRTAASNTVRSKLRTTLTVLALFVGAFTLALTTALGAGVSQYVTNQVAALGSDDVLLISASTDAAADGPVEYDPDTSAPTQGTPNPLTGNAGGLTDADLTALEGVDGLSAVEPIESVSIDWIRTGSSSKYELGISPTSSIAQADLASGAQLDRTGSEAELIIPSDYVDVLGFDDAADAVGATATIGVTDILGEAHELEATIVGVSNAGLLTTGAGANTALVSEIAEIQRAGTESSGTYQAATAHFDPSSTPLELIALKERIADEGMTAQTLADQLGVIQTVITGITGVLNAFAIVALLAAAFGIVNTLLMSVQERTRDIGLMKAMGMPSGRVFALFSLEAVIIGLLGSLVGVGAAMLLGFPLNSALASGPLAGLEGINILLFEPASIAGVVLLVVVIAFLAGALPASRAARKAPIDALRYE